MRTTVRELITHDIDMDVFDDVYDEEYPAFVGPMYVTEAGEKEWKDVLDLECEVEKYIELYIDDIDDDIVEARHNRAHLFFSSAAGYCYDDLWNKWFYYKD